MWEGRAPQIAKDHGVEMCLTKGGAVGASVGKYRRFYQVCLHNCPSRCDLTHSHQLAFNKTLDIKNKSCLYELGKAKVSHLFHTRENWGWGLPGWTVLVKFLRGSLVLGERSWWTCSSLDEGLEKKANGKTHSAMWAFAFSWRENIVPWWWAHVSPFYACMCRRVWGSGHAC